MDIKEIAKTAGIHALDEKSWYIASPAAFEKLVQTIINAHEKEKWLSLCKDITGAEKRD